MKHPLLEQALMAHQQGDLVNAELGFQKYLEKNPQDAQATYLLGMVNQQQHNYKQSIHLITKAISINSESAQYFLSLGLSYDRNHQIDMAEEAYSKAEQMRPDVFQVHYDIGCFMQHHSRFEEAARYFEKTLELNPKHFPAYTNLASALQRLGELEKAENISRKINSLVPNNTQLMNNLAQLLIEKENYGEAMSLLEKAISIDANDSAVQMTYGKLNYLVNNKNFAEQIFKKIIKLEPQNYKAQSLLAKCLIDKEQFEQAQVLLEECLKYSPEYLGAVLSQAELHAGNGNFKNSIEIYLKGIEKHPGSVELYYGLGIIYSQQGTFDKAIQYFMKALKISNTYTQALHAITKITHYKDLENDEVKVALELKQKVSSNSNALTTNQKVDLYFSLGKIYDDLKQIDNAFEYYRFGNQLRNHSNPYNIEEFIKFNQHTKQTFQNFEVNNKLNTSKYNSIFIVGMPRSGTTLLEQILSSHSEISAAGELSEIQQISKNIEQYPNFELSNGNVDVEKHRAIYETKLKSITGLAPKSWVVDKNPINFRHIGLIKMIFPEAKIVHMKRHPLDTIISIYFQQLSEGHKYAFDLQSLADYYIKYQELMLFWEQQFPTDIIACRYDDLVSDTRRSITHILNRMGFDWQQSCENFHQQQRKVVTASAWQVRQPIYNSSVERWKQYRHHLSSIETILSDNIKNWDNGAVK